MSFGRNEKVYGQNEDSGLSAVFQIDRGRPKQGVFGIFRGQNDVLRLEGLECNNGKSRGLLQKGKSTKDKIGRAKVQFWKVLAMGIRPAAFLANQTIGIARGMVGEQSM